MTTMSLCGLWSTFCRCRCGKIVLLLLIIIFSGLSVQAHHESLAAPEREYLKLISLHPFKDTVIHNNGYDFYITVVELAPRTVDLIFYIENPLFKRPVHSVKEILLYQEGSLALQRFALGTDITGVSSLRYRYQKPFEAKLKIITVAPDHQNLSAETTIQIGSPKASYLFLIVFGIILIISIIFVYIRQKR